MKTWLTEELKLEVRRTFEPRYNRKLSDEEVVEIANNLVSLTEHTLTVFSRRKNGKS